MSDSPRTSCWSKAAPGLSLMILSPILAEILPGATRLSSLFVLPVEIAMWGGGALFIRYAVRRWGLGWRNMLLLALALSVAEECLIQQTSLAPLVVQVKGQGYARALDLNYLYLLWALGYESVFVVFTPVYLTELIFAKRRGDLWLSKGAMIPLSTLFALGAFLAWFSWTQIARPRVFHVPIYHPSLAHLLVASAAISLLVISALGPFRGLLVRPSRPLRPPDPWVLSVASCLWATLWYGLVLLAFGIAPQVPPALPMGGGLLLSAAALVLLPRWAGHPRWEERHQFAAVFGAILGSMLLSFVGFIGSLPMDLYFKVAVDLLALMLLLVLRRRLRQHWAEDLRGL